MLLKNLHTSAKPRVVFFATALPANPPRKFVASIKGQMRLNSNDFGANKFIHLKFLKMELIHENGAVVKNENTKTPTNINAQNGVAKKEQTTAITKPQISNAKVEASKVKEEPKAISETAKAEIALSDRLKLVSELHRKSVQRSNLLTRIRVLEEFEVALQQDNDELADNPYQGCKLIIRDDKNHDFLTTTPGLIRMVANFVKSECTKKLVEIESTIIFPNA